MLGLGSSLLQGGALRSIVRSGLQLFYKADRTQAPLGEEQVRNNSFDEIGGNLVSNPTFDLGSEEVQNGSFDELGPDKIDNGNFENDISGWAPVVSGDSTVTYNSGLKGIKLTKVGSGACKTQNVNSDNVQGETYKLIYRVLENNNCTHISVWNGATYEGSTVLNVEANGEDFVYYLEFTGGGVNDLYLQNNTADSDITLSNIKLEKVDPNDNWTKRNGSTINNVANVIAGGNIGGLTAYWSLESLGDVFEPSKTYQIKFRAKQVSLAGSNAGNFQVGNSYGILFDEVITSEFVDYTFTTQVSSNNWPKLTVGGRTAGDVFQIDNVSVKEVPNWGLGDGWSIANDVAIQSGGVGQLSQTGVLAAGKSYSVSVTIDSIASGTSLKVSLGSGGDELLFSNIGTTTLIGSTSSSVGNQILYLLGNESGFSGSISNISVKQLDPNNRWNVLNPDTSAHTVEIREGETYINYDHDGGTQGGTGITQSGVFPNTTSKYEIEVELGEVTGELKVQARGISTTINSSDSNTTKVILLDSSSDSQTHIMIVRLEDYISGSAFVKNVSVKEITNSIKDHSRNSNDGILYSGKALALDPGTNAIDYVSLRPSNEMGISSAGYTFAIWFNADTTQDDGSDKRIFTSRRAATGSYFAVLLTSSGHLKVYFKPSGNLQSIIISTNYRDDNWHRLVISASTNAQYIYVDNKLVGTSTYTLGGIPSSDLAYLGAGVTPGEATMLKCKLADFQIYDKAWNATDVKYDWENPDKDVFDRVGEAQILGHERIPYPNLNETGLTGWNTSNTSSPDYTITATEQGVRYVNNGASSSPAHTFSISLGNNSIVSGKTYSLEVVISEFRGTGGIKFASTSALNSYPPSSPGTINFNSAGTHTHVFTAGDNLAGFSVYRNSSNVDLTIKSISIKEVTTHASHILPTDCKSLLRLNEGAGDRVYDAAPVLGAEKVINTNFESNTGFSEGTGWNINNNLATHTGSTGNLGIISSWVSGGSYKIVFTIDVIDDGVCNVYDSSTATTYARFDTDGTKTLFIKKDSTSELALRSSSSNCEISFLSVKEIKPAESFFITGDKNFIHQQPYIPQYAMSSFSKKMVFDGSNDYVACGSDASIDNIFSGGGTISAWISPRTDGGENLGTIIGKGTVSIRVKDDDNDGVILNLAKGFSTTNADFLTSDEVVLENKMNHIAITYNDSASSNTPSFYVNGVLKAIDTSSSTTPVGSASTDASSNLIIGNVLAGGSRSFDGIIDEVSLFKTVLTQAEVLELYNSGSSFDSTGHSKYNLGEEVSNGTLDLGSEEVVNGDFATDLSNWTIELGDSTHTVTHTSNGARFKSDTTTPTLTFTSDTANIVSGRSYEIKVVISEYQGSNGIKIQNSATGNVKYLFDSVDTFTYNFTAVSNSSTPIQFYRDGANVDITIESVSLKEIPNWSFGDGWSYVDGKASLVQVGGPQATDLLKQELTGLVNGRTYVISFDLDITSSTVTTIGLSNTGAFGDTSSSDRFHSTNGRKTLTAVYNSSHQSGIKELRFVGGSNTEFTIDNVSVQEYGVSGYWRNNGADQWDDLSINSNHGTVSGSPTEIFLQEVPFFGKDSLGMFMNKPRLGGLNLNASGYVNIEDNNDLDFGTGAFTMECWVTAKYENIGSSINVILGLGGNTSQPGSAGIVSFDSNKLGGYVNAATLSANSTFTEGNWYHVVITRSSGTCKLYIDTVLQNDTETSGGSITNSNAKQIGKDTTTTRGYDGVVDDVKLYSKALTPAEIKKNYNATKGKHKN